MLSHYRLVEKIGEGGMGVVWKAEDEKLHRPVALKILPPEVARDERRQRFLREARAAAALTHPNIATVHEIDESHGVVFIAMEYVEGKTLRALLGGRSLPVREALHLGTQVAEGLARAHQRRVIHRDLKPENVMVGPDGHAKILDFGLVKLLEENGEAASSPIGEAETITREMTREGAVLGTPPYMSPEQARGLSVDARSDVFAFGIVLYEMVTGRRPFRGATTTDTINAIINEHPIPASQIKREVLPELERIVGKCLEKDPRGRYQDSRDLVVDLRRLGRELDAGSVPSSGEINRARPRRPRRLALLVAALLVAAGTGFMLYRDRPVGVPAKPAYARTEIAVLPFQNLSPGGPHAYFAGGLHEEVLTQLAKVAALKVISRTSVMGYRETTRPLKEIAAELGVGSVVDGSVQVEGGRLRVNVQLIDAVTDKNLWAERYDRTLDDAFAIQSDVAQHVAAAVGATLTDAELGSLSAAPTSNPEAYRLYLQGQDYQNRPGYLPQDRESAQKLFEQVLALDPNFALAHAALSQVHGVLYFLRYDPSQARAARQREEAEAALRLAPGLPRAHFAMGLVHYLGRGDFRRALDEFTIALKGSPSDAEVWLWIGWTQQRLGNWDKVLEAFEQAVRLDPRRADLFNGLGGTTYQLLRRYPDALRAYDQALSLAPDLHDAALNRAWTLVAWRGQLDTLREFLERLPKDAQLALAAVDGIRAELLLFERNADGLLAMPSVSRGDVFEGANHFVPAALYAGWAHQLRGDRAMARASFESAHVSSESALNQSPDDLRVHAALGLALAGLGRREQALREARWLQQSTRYRDDAFIGPALAEDCARILAQAGDAEAALDEIDRLLAGPSWLSVHALRLDPRWDPIREHPRFKALLAKYGAAAVR